MKSICRGIALSVVASLALLPAVAAAVEPPETAISAGPQGPTSDSSPSFHFGSDRQGASFECRLDGGTWTLRAPRPAGPVAAHVLDDRWQSCVSPKSYRHLADGPHRFEVRAVDGDGVADPTPATRRFDLDTAVRAEVGVPDRQAQRRREVRVGIAVAAAEDVLVRARGSLSLARPTPGGILRVALRRRSARVGAGERRTVGLRAQRRSQGRRIAAALRSGNRARAKVTVRLANRSGSTARRRFTARLIAPD